MKKMISWNVNGLRACVGKGFLDYFKEMDADIFCIQESKLQEGQIELDLEGYHQYWNYAKKKGYSGTALFTKEEPVSVAYGIGIEEHDQEGRVITAEFADYYVVTCYTPIFTRIRKGYIPGGLTGLRPERKTPAGVLTIFVYQSV